MFLRRLVTSLWQDGYRVRWNTIVFPRMKAMTITSHQKIPSAHCWRLTRHYRASSSTAAKEDSDVWAGNTFLTTPQRLLEWNHDFIDINISVFLSSLFS